MLCNIDVGTANTLASTRVAKHAILRRVYYITSILDYIHCLYDSYSYANYIIYSTSVVYISTSLA